MHLERIKIYTEQRRIPFKTLASSIGMSEGNLHRCVRENKIQANDLEKIAIALRIPIGFFFDENDVEIREAGRDYVENGNIEHRGTEYNGSASIEQDLRAQIAQLKSQLEDKERIIKLLEDKQ